MVHYDQFRLGGLGFPKPDEKALKILLQIATVENEEQMVWDDNSTSLYPSKVIGTEANPRFRFDWRLSSKTDWSTADQLKPGFWSDLSRFPGGATHGSVFHVWSLIFNLVFVALCFLVVCFLVERRIRKRGRLLRVSLKETLVVLTLVSAGLAWAVDQHLKMEVEYDDVATMKSVFQPDPDNSWDAYFSVTTNRCVPTIISELMDHRLATWNGKSFLQRIDSAIIYVSADFHFPKSPEAQLAFEDAWNRVTYPIELQIDAPSKAWKRFSQLDLSSVVQLEIQYTSPFNVVSFPLGDDEKIVSHEPLEVPNLNTLTLYLPDTEQGKQLANFSNCTHAERIRIYDLNREGAKYLLSSNWPSHVEIEFAYIRPEFRSSTNDDWQDRIGERFRVLPIQ